MEQVKGSKNDLPTSPNAKDAGLLAALSGPVDMVELKSALLKHGGKIKHAGGALPPLFPEKGVREGDARLVSYLGHEVVPEDRAGGGGNGGFVVLNFDVLDHTKPSFPVSYRAQMVLNATLETYFQAVKLGEWPDKKQAEKLMETIGRDEDFRIPTRDPEKTPILIITYAGQMAAKKANFAGAKRWIVEEFTPAKN